MSMRNKRNNKAAAAISGRGPVTPGGKKRIRPTLSADVEAQIAMLRIRSLMCGVFGKEEADRVLGLAWAAAKEIAETVERERGRK